MKNNRGITMVELLVGMAVLSVVGLFAASFLSSALWMYRTTINYADVQTEGQAISRRLSNGIMKASGLYFDDSPKGTVLFTGKITEGDSAVSYGGEIFWLDKETGEFYQNDTFFLEVPREEEKNGEQAPLTAELVGSALTGISDPREYLVGENVQELIFTLAPELTPEDRIQTDSSFYMADQRITVHFAITLRDKGDKDYMTGSGATPRNKVSYLRFQTVK